jgi:photosystem II stability/assembly factor-like uncharacterized protein
LPGLPDNQIPHFDDDELDRFLARAKDRSARLRVRQHRILSLGAVTSILVIVALASTLVGLHNSDPATPGQATPTSGPPPVGAVGWILVGDISPSWQVISSLSSTPGLSLTCPSVETCFAADLSSPGTAGLSAVEVTHDGGRTWTSSELPVALRGLAGPSAGQTRIACPTASTCAVLGLSGSVSCSDANSCTVHSPAATFEETTDGGASWRVRAGPAGLSGLGVSAMVCPSTSSCLAAADGYGAAAIFVTSDGGQTWVRGQMPADFVSHTLQCPSTENCVVTGFYQSPDRSGTMPEAAVLHTTDGGRTWTAASLPSGLGPIGEVSCETATDCVATFATADGNLSTVLASSDGGASWSSVRASGLPDGVVLSITCTGAAQCRAAGVTDAQVSAQGMTISAGATPWFASTTDGGQTWQSTTVPDGVSVVASVSCPSAARCYALGFAKPAGSGFFSVVLLSDGH